MKNQQNQEKGLKRELGLTPAMALVIGMVIGSGIFMKPGIVLAAAGDSTMGLAAWLLGGMITVTAGLTVAELGAQITKTGGLYAYLDEVYGRFWSYLFGWVQTIIYGPASIGALGLYLSTLLIPFFGLSAELKLPIAIMGVAFLAGVNSLGAKYGGFIQSAATAAKLIPIICIAIFGLLEGKSQILGVGSGISGPAAGMGAAILATLWAYDGWIAVGFVAGEMKNPAKQLPQAIIIGLGIVILAYLLVNLAMLHVLPAQDIVALGKQAAGTTAGLLFGDIGGKLINIGIIVSIFGALNGYILTNARVPYAMAVQKQLPAAGLLAKVHGSFGTPVNATIFQVLLTVILMTAGDPDRLTDIAMFVMQIFYIFAFVAVFIMRRRSKTPRPYSVPLYPVVPVIAIAGALYIVMSTLMNNPTDTLYALGIACAGIPVYLLINRTGRADNQPE